MVTVGLQDGLFFGVRQSFGSGWLAEGGSLAAALKSCILDHARLVCGPQVARVGMDYDIRLSTP